ncbi:MAG: hypothetical protein MUF31_04455 [Akkermansiaceae bacterium]|jgi:hypothetical protein|nr:hypothetical protein [Akkermansiaceae bacterium]
MKISNRAFALAGILALSCCDDADWLWKDGNYRVYTRPNSQEIILGYHFGDGGVLGLSEATVTAAGADVRYVVFQVNHSSNYYILKEADGEGSTQGPFDEKQFETIRRQLSLPLFEWHLRR